MQYLHACNIHTPTIYTIYTIYVFTGGPSRIDRHRQDPPVAGADPVTDVRL